MATSHDPAGTSTRRLADDASVAELVKQLSEHTSRLARQEVELAKAELAEKGKRAGLGAGTVSYTHLRAHETDS